MDAVDAVDAVDTVDMVTHGRPQPQQQRQESLVQTGKTLMFQNLAGAVEGTRVEFT